MATKGLSLPVFGKYENNNGTVTYSEPMILDKAVEYSVSWTTGDDNPFYADNNIAENDKGSFQSGELTLSTADLSQEISQIILGTKTKTDTVKIGEENTTVTTQVFDDSRNSPYLGVGIIELHQVNDKDQRRAVFFHKVYFNIPEEAATTKEDEIDWQAKEITGIIQRSDEVSSDVTHPWMTDAWFDTESEALAWLKYKCGEVPTTQETSY